VPAHSNPSIVNALSPSSDRETDQREDGMTSLTSRGLTFSSEMDDFCAPRHHFPIVKALLAAVMVANIASAIGMLLAA